MCTIRQRLRAFPVVAILGSRQIGKTTLARQVAGAHAGPTQHLDLGLPDGQVHFWAAHTGAELDLVVTRGRRRIGIEIKRTTKPKVTRSIRSALGDLDLAEAVVVHAGSDSYRLAAGVRAVAARRLDADLKI